MMSLSPTYPVEKSFTGYKNRFSCRTEYQGIKFIRLGAVMDYRDSALKKILK